MKIVGNLSEIGLAVTIYKSSKKSIKKMVEISKEAEELSKFLELEAFI